MRPFVRLVVACSLASLLPAGVSASAPQDPAARDARSSAGVEACGLVQDLPCYHVILDAYAEGRRDQAVGAIVKWKPDQMEKRSGFLDTAGDPREPWEIGRYATAVMLHTDAALRLNARVISAESFAHLRTAAALLAEDGRGRMSRSARRTPAMNQAVRALAERWYLAMARYLRDRSAMFVARDLLALGRVRLPKDPVVLAESAIQAESLATFFALANQPRDDYGVYWSMEKRATNLVAAAGWLREAAALDPDNEVARVHLGRVLALRQEDDEALRVLGSVAGTSRDDRVAYLALMFTAAIHERRDRLDEAASTYRSAMSRLPQGFAAPLGLSEVLQRLGKGDESRQVLRALLTEAAGAADDPLWVYRLDPPRAVDARLDALREEATR